MRSKGTERLKTREYVRRVIPITRPSDELKIDKKLVVFFDICSSSKLVNDLLSSDQSKIKYYRNLLIVVRQFLVEQEEKGLCEVYNFIGDGWVLLLPPDSTGEAFISLLSNLSVLFERQLGNLTDRLNSTPEVMGLTFGVDKGDLVRLVLDGKRADYIGHPLNLAARLQAAVKDTPEDPAYRALISKNTFQDLEISPKYRFVKVTRKLRNMLPETCECFELSVINRKSGA